MMKTTNTIEDSMMERVIFEQSENQAYEVISWKITDPDYEEAGELILKDLNTAEIDKYQIWLGDEDLSYYYVCLNSEDEEGEYEDFNLEDFEIHVFRFSALSQDSRIVAAEAYAEEKRQEGRAYTFQHAYRKLLKGQPLLFDIEGRPAWNSCTVNVDGEERHYV